MSYILHYAPGTASFAIHWMLVELGAPFQAVALDLKAGAQKDAGYLALNPAGRVPTLIVDGAPVAEAAALAMLLAERHPESGFAPLVGDPGRGRWLETVAFIANGLAPAMRDHFYADKDGDPEGADAVRGLAQRRIEAAWDRLDAQLADGRPYLAGDAVTAADFLALMYMRWSRNMPRPADTWTRLAPYITRLRARPGFLEVCRREGLTDWTNT